MKFQHHPLVTISIPIYKNKYTIEACLSSIKHQSYKQIEVNIIYGSKDGEILKVAKRFGIKKIKFCQK